MSKKSAAAKAAPAPRDWLSAAIAVGIVYLVIGRVAGWATTDIIAWRYVAAGICGVVYIVHAGYEKFLVRSTALHLALHVAIGTAIGGLLYAVAGITNAVMSGAPANFAAWGLAFVAWPLLVAIPAWIVGYAVGRFVPGPAK